MSEMHDAVIYVDGSFDAKTKAYSYGMMVSDDIETKYFCKAYACDEFSSMRNIAGEIAGAGTALQYAFNHGYKKINLIFDYLGIMKWCTGEWQAKNAATQAYKRLYDSISQYIDIEFTHVRGHMGIEGNEICDALAKYVLNLPDTKERRRRYADILSSAVSYESGSDAI